MNMGERSMRRDEACSVHACPDRPLQRAGIGLRYKLLASCRALLCCLSRLSLIATT